MFARCGAVLLILLVPAHLSAEEPRGDARRIESSEVKVAHRASRWVLGVQAEERRAAQEAGLDDLAEKIEALQQATERLGFVEAAFQLQSSPQGMDPAAAARLTALREKRRQHFQDRVQGIAQRRTELEGRIDDIPSPRQRRMARRLVEKLAELEAEASQTLGAPESERASRLSVLARRLSVSRYGIATYDADPEPTPTFQMQRAPEVSTGETSESSQ